MKTIELKKLGNKGEDGAIDYKELIQMIVQLPTDPRVGLGVEEIRKAVRILDLLDESKKTLTLEDADYNVLKEKLSNHKFGIAHKNIIVFVDDIDNAKDVVEKKKKTEK